VSASGKEDTLEDANVKLSHVCKSAKSGDYGCLLCITSMFCLRALAVGPFPYG
jgi:hypothetical protein